MADRHRHSAIKLFPNELEAANRAEVTALLIRAGFRVYRPEADVHGEDMVIRTPAGELRSVQLKSRPWVDWKRYGGRETWMLFPEPGYRLGRPWYLVEHDKLYSWFERRHSRAPKWDQHWRSPTVTKALRLFLEPFRESQWFPAGMSTAEPNDGASVVSFELIGQAGT